MKCNICENLFNTCAMTEDRISMTKLSVEVDNTKFCSFVTERKILKTLHIQGRTRHHHQSFKLWSPIQSERGQRKTNLKKS